MSWTTAPDELRVLLNDGPTDKPYWRKRLFGEVNGTNVKFKNLEYRRVTDFTTSVAPFGVFVDGIVAGIDLDFAATGDVILTTAPNQGSIVEASYYTQWFLDIEITQFLTDATKWLSLGTDYTAIESGLQPGLIKYAASEAYQKLALKMATHIQETYLLNDSPDEKRFQIVDTYMKQAALFGKQAQGVRDDFYSRSGEQLQPLFANNPGRIRDTVPKR